MSSSVIQSGRMTPPWQFVGISPFSNAGMNKGKLNGAGPEIMAGKSHARRPDAEQCHGETNFFSLALHAG
jgi:hypothetical protein